MTDNIVDLKEKQPPGGYGKWIKLALVVIGLVAAVIIFIANMFIVEQNEYKVVRQFGEVIRIEDDPGLKMKVPFIQTVESLPRHQMSYDVEPTEITTSDTKRMLVDNYAVWQVSDPGEMISNARTIQNAESIMANFINSVLRSELGTMEYDEIINEEESARGDINENIRDRVNEMLERDSYGLEITDVRIKRTDLPEDNERAIHDRMISERESIAQEYLSEGDAEATRIRAETDREVQEMVAEAEADAEEIRGGGEAEAAAIYNDAYSVDNDFYEFYRTLQSYEVTIDDETVIVLPADSPYARILMGYTD
ncbi:protease modulator HflC [Salsuginibacillus kocurii]|uniref:protease modulator HflC n=1 Tax=Salsuginibacillus kocurii TaxID=427078 RepID=UPI00037B77AF|nr:protease modulator HflC [Salsuginibacillus kocurii]